jgi:DNA-binding PadR family transcriptional regulator
MFGHRLHGLCGRRFAHGRFAEGGEGFWGRHRGFGGGRRGRVFDQGDLRFVVLLLIAEKPRHGYEIIKAIEDQLGGAYSPSPGVVYPTLTLLEDLGYATVTAGDGGKKLYTLTAEGKAFLDANRGAVDSVMARIAEVKAAYGEGPAPQIIRAMENLRTALRLRMSRAPLSDAEVQSMAAAIDAAASAVERA